MNVLRGLPLLSGPIPDDFTIDERAEMSCRKCNKEFNLFTRGRRCEHCGYHYCNSCSDFQALMPRIGFGSGYDRVAVCAFCIQYLQITAGGKAYLRTLPLTRLKNYIQSYGLRLGPSVIEKEDVINEIVIAREHNGCLPAYHEDFYRKNAVPNGQTSRPRGMFSRAERNPIPQQHLDARSEWRNNSNFARPDLEGLGQAMEGDQSYQPTGNVPRTRSQDDARPQVSTSGTNTSYAFSSQPQPNQYAPPPGPPPSFNQSRSTYPPNPPPFNADLQPSAHPSAFPHHQFHEAPYHPPAPPWPRPSQPPPQRFQNPPQQWQARPQSSASPYPPSLSYSQPHFPSPTQSWQEPPERRRSAQFTPQFSTHTSPRPQTPRPRPTSTNISETNTPRPRTASFHSNSSPRARPSPTASPTAASTAASSTAAVPSLEELLETDEEALIHLSVSTLKAILFQNHVNIGSLPILEKGELVDGVKRLLDEERRERVHAEAVREREEWEKAEKEWAERDARKEREESERRARRERLRPTVEDASDSSEDGEPSRMAVDGSLGNSDVVFEFNEDARNRPSEHASAGPDTGPTAEPPLQQSPPVQAHSPSPPSKFPQERSGLCVVCQDEESNIVIIDCGHLALCRGCADLVWTSSRECPLCRTRIVTEARMLRIFKS